MEFEPKMPLHRHVFVRGHGDIGPPDPGLVLSWQHSPVHNATSADWVALVATCPFDTALHLQWVSAERLLAVRDPAPSGPAATDVPQP